MQRKALSLSISGSGFRYAEFEEHPKGFKDKSYQIFKLV